MSLPERRKFFWITPKWPLPAEDGARRATVYLVKSLAGLGADIHLCAIVPEGEKVDTEQAKRELGVKEVSVVHRQPSRHLKNLLLHPLQPLTIAPYSSRRVAAQIERILQGSADHGEVVFDGLHAAGWLQNASQGLRASLRKVYRAHNVESSLWVQGARQQKYRLMSCFLKYQAKLVADFEKKICRESVLVAAVSRDDEAGLQKLYGPLSTKNIPIGGAPANRTAGGEFPGERRVLFLGRLDWQPNREGLKWFLENVWSDAVAQSPDLQLTIAGAGDGKWLEAYAGLKNVRMLGRVPEVAPLYRESIASLVPVFFGSGTRVKAIEASSFARPCISTAIGIEGIGLDSGVSYFRAETREDWLRALSELRIDEAKRRGAAAFEVVSREFDPDNIAARFLGQALAGGAPR